MQHEKIFKRPDGSKVKIDVRVYLNGDGANYNVFVFVCQNGKRTWQDTHDSDNYRWRALNPDDRIKFILNEQLKVCTAAEILEVKTELWQLLNPTKNKK